MKDSKPSPFRLIWITPRFPSGTPDGAQHATRSLLRHLIPLVVGIDLICITPADEPADIAAMKKELNVSSCTIISRSRSFLSRLPTFGTPFTFRTFAASEVCTVFRQRLTSLLKAADSPQHLFIVFDGLHPFAALGEAGFQGLSDRCRGIVYRAHNVETTFWEQSEKQARTPWFRWFFRHQAALVRSFERRIAQNVNLIAPVSENDADKFKTLAPGAVISMTPIGMDFPEEQQLQPIRDSATLVLLFIGRLDWIPNRKGLEWFLENVWPRVVLERPQTALKIAGVGDGRWLQKFRNLPGIEFLGKVAEVKPLYDSCSLAIAPLFQGSGTRVKIIEAARYGRAVLTTALGAEGTDLVEQSSYFRAETQEEWLNKLVTITPPDCQSVGLSAFRKLRERFEGKLVAERFVYALESLSR